MTNQLSHTKQQGMVCTACGGGIKGKMMASNLDRATEIVAKYTLVASATGAIPVPAASAAVVAENAVMIAQIADAMGAPVDVKTVTSSFGIAASINIIGRTLFIEGARLLAWGTASVWAAPTLSALGAATAGIQTYIVGQLAMAICKNNGKALGARATKAIISDAKAGFDDFLAYWKTQKINEP